MESPEPTAEGGAVPAKNVPAVRRLASVMAERLSASVVTVLVVGFAALAALATVETVAWTFFDRSWAAMQEIQALLLIWLAVLGAAWGVWEGFHIAVELVANRLPARVRPWIDTLAVGLTGVLGVLLSIHGTALVRRVGNTLPGTGWPASMQYLPMAVGGALIALFALARLLVGSERAAVASGTPAQGEPDA